MPTIYGQQSPDKRFEYRSAGPGTATDISTKTVYVQLVVLCNTSGGALTVSIKDRASTPIEFTTAKSVGANDTVVYGPFNPPMKMVDGINLNAPAGVDVQIYGLQEAV